MIDIQEQVNDYANIQAENYEFGIPPIIADPQVLDFDALGSTSAEPASWYPGRARAGRSLADDILQMEPSKVAPDMAQYAQELAGPVAQFLSGMFPAVFGGEMENVKTASGYAMARDQAMGRIGLIYRRLKQWYADVILMAVDCFRKNRPEDVEAPKLGEDNEFEERLIRIADLKGNIQARPEPDETYPRLKSQQRAAVRELMESNDPEIAAILGYPANVGQIRSLLGLSDFTIPGENERNKQLREIEQMMKEQPIQQPPDPMTGQTAPMMSSVEIDPLLDNHKVEFEECLRWASSDDGQEARIQNPAGFANVRAHAAQHQAMLMQQAMASMPPPPPPRGGPPKPGGEKLPVGGAQVEPQQPAPVL
jgi:hypothetical protein